MTVRQLCEKAGFSPVTELNDVEVNGAYCCDLLSWIIGRAKENAALVTVMTNVNVIAVAVMAELSCVVLTEGVILDAAALEKARQNGVAVLSSEKPSYETSVLIHNLLGK